MAKNTTGSKGQLTQNRIIQAAIKIFYKNGYQRTTFEQIAKEAKLQQPHIYAYFKNKEDLLLSCTRVAIAEGRQFIDEYVRDRQDPKEKLRSYIEANLRWFTEHPEQGELFYAVFFLGFSNKDIKAFHQQFDEGAIERIQSIRGTTYEEARRIHNALVGEILKGLQWPDEFNIETRIKMVY